jgi:hypothetical protein
MKLRDMTNNLTDLHGKNLPVIFMKIYPYLHHEFSELVTRWTEDLADSVGFTE